MTAHYQPTQGCHVPRQPGKQCPGIDLARISGTRQYDAKVRIAGSGSISTSYYPLWVADGTALESPETIPDGPDNLIEELGHRFARAVELLRARMPTPDEARLLELEPGVPVVRMLHIDYDPDGRTLQVADDLYAGDRHEFAVEWAEPDGSGPDG